MRFAVIALAALLTACGSTAMAPEPTATFYFWVLLPGEHAANPCEESLVAYYEYVRDGGLEMRGDYGVTVFANCNYADFVGANAKMADRYRISNVDDHLERNCDQVTSVYAGSFLCVTRGD
jgi:hypothetical protein